MKAARKDVLIAATALFAFCWAVARACFQSITIDEATTYLLFVGRSQPFHWYAAANNHVLNSALMRLFTTVFGLSHLTVRAPALIGAAIYITAAWYLCHLIANSLWLEWSLFVCLVYNPFVFDYMVAARGYGLASAFLVCAIAAAAHWRARNSSPFRACALCSIFVALSFASNFSFALADLVTLAAVFIWIARRERKSYVRLVTACNVPGAAVTLALTLSTLLAWPKGQLTEGVTSLRLTISSVIESSLYQLNPEVANPLLLKILDWIRPALFPALGVLAVWNVAELFRKRRESWLAELSLLLAGIAIVTFSVHAVAFRIFHLLLPFNRTALFFVPLGTLAVGALAAVRPSRSMTALMYVFAVYFLACLRLSYFHEWQWGADVRSTYPVVAWYNHNFCVDRVSSNWLYVSQLNFYRRLSGRETFPELKSDTPYPGDASLYVLNSAFDQAFIDSQHLEIVYRGETTPIVVAVRPDRLTGCPK